MSTGAGFCPSTVPPEKVWWFSRQKKLKGPVFTRTSDLRCLDGHNSI